MHFVMSVVSLFFFRFSFLFLFFEEERFFFLEEEMPQPFLFLSGCMSLVERAQQIIGEITAVPALVWVLFGT